MISIQRLTNASEKAVSDINAIMPQLRSDAETSRASLEDLQLVVSDKNTALLVVTDDEKIIGMATLYVIQKLGKRGGVVEDVVVDEAYRGQGLGEKLMRALLDEAKSLGVRSLQLTSRPSRVAAHKLYKKLGFTEKETTVFKLKI